MFCRECGNEFPDGTAACPVCGTPVVATSTPETQVQQPAQAEPAVQPVQAEQPAGPVAYGQPQQAAYGQPVAYGQPPQPQQYQPGYPGQPVWQQPGTMGATGREGQATAGLVLGLIGAALIVLMFLGQGTGITAVCYIASIPVTIVGIVMSAKGLKSARQGAAIGGLVTTIIDLVVIVICLFVIIYIIIVGASLYY